VLREERAARGVGLSDFWGFQQIHTMAGQSCSLHGCEESFHSRATRMLIIASSWKDRSHPWLSVVLIYSGRCRSPFLASSEKIIFFLGQAEQHQRSRATADWSGRKTQCLASSSTQRAKQGRVYCCSSDVLGLVVSSLNQQRQALFGGNFCTFVVLGTRQSYLPERWSSNRSNDRLLLEKHGTPTKACTELLTISPWLDFVVEILWHRAAWVHVFASSVFLRWNQPIPHTTPRCRWYANVSCDDNSLPSLQQNGWPVSG